VDVDTDGNSAAVACAIDAISHDYDEVERLKVGHHPSR